MVTRPDVPIPTSPGAYLFRDTHGRVLYVGKAKSLRSRLANYFGDPSRMAPRTAAMVEIAATVEWVLAESEVGALMLEYTLIKQHRPRFNVRLRDDKSYPYLAITLNQEWPRPTVMRGRKRKGIRYFGPYAHTYAIRETLDLILRTFPVRTCSDGKFEQHQRLGRPCLYYHIERCSGPCVGRVDHERYDRLLAELIEFLEGDHAPVIERLEKEMYSASDGLEFELAARLRDQLQSVRRASERQQMVTDRREDLDVLGIHGDELELAVAVFNVRGGRIRGQRGFIVENVEDKAPDELLADVLLEMYGGSDDIPKSVEVPHQPEDSETLQELLTLRRAEQTGRELPPGIDQVAADSVALTTGDPGTANYKAGHARGGRVLIHVPRWGDRKDLLDTATANAEQSFLRHRMKRQSDHNARARALTDLQQALDLPEAPLRIECFDISQVQGSNPVASMVVFEDALPRKDAYRRFSIKTVDQQDDFAMMREALTRRFTAYLAERRAVAAETAAVAAGAGGMGVRGESRPTHGRTSSHEAGGPPSTGAKPDQATETKKPKFAYPPGLLLIDGGRGQLNVALDVLAELGLDADIPAAGLAKQFEEVYLPGVADTVRLPRGSEALYLLQRVRDEAHRFAITYHRSRRGKAMVSSVLDDVPGLGPARRRKLLQRFGSVRKLREASVDDLAATPGIPAAVATAVHDKLQESPRST